MESRKTVLMNLFAGQEWRCTHREWTCGHSRQRRGWDKLRKVALTYTQSCVKQAGGKLLCNRELSSVLHDDLEEQDGGEAQQGRDMCIHTADSHCCTAETNMIL